MDCSLAGYGANLWAFRFLKFLLEGGMWEIFEKGGIAHTDKQSWARDNTVATTRPCFQATTLTVIAILLYLEWLLHLDTETLIFFEFCLVPEALICAAFTEKMIKM